MKLKYLIKLTESSIFIAMQKSDLGYLLSFWKNSKNCQKNLKTRLYSFIVE